MSANKRTEIDELHSFLKSKLMHKDDPRRRLIDDAFRGTLDTPLKNDFCTNAASRMRQWPYLSASVIYNRVWHLNISPVGVNTNIIIYLNNHLADFPRLAYLNVSIDDPMLGSFWLLIDELLRIPEFRDFWAGFELVEQKERMPEDKSNIPEEIRKAVNVEVNSWKRSFERDLKDELRERIKHELKQEMRQEIRNELEAELRVSIEEELKAEFREHIETRLNEEIKATVRLAERAVSNEEDSNLVNKEPANGLSMEDVRNETKIIVTETIEELTGDLVSILEPKIKAKITKIVKDELKDELTEEVTNDLMDFKRHMKKKLSKMMNVLREQLHEDFKDEIMQTIQQDLKKCLLDLRKTDHK